MGDYYRLCFHARSSFAFQVSLQLRNLPLMPFHLTQELFRYGIMMALNFTCHILVFAQRLPGIEPHTQLANSQ